MALTPEERSKMGRRSRRKGQTFERWVANNLKDLWPDAKRGYQARGGTSAAPDVDFTPYYIEAKNEKSTKPKAALEQAREGSDGRTPLAITKDTDGTGTVYVTMDFEEFKRLHLELKDLTIQRDGLGAWEDEQWMKTPFTKQQKKAINDAIDDPDNIENW